MAEPTHFSCPDCAYAFRPDDPRVAVPAGEANRVIACPGCRGMIRVWPGGGPPPPASYVGCVVAAAIVVALFIAYQFSVNP